MDSNSVIDFIVNCGGMLIVDKENSVINNINKQRLVYYQFKRVRETISKSFSIRVQNID